MILTIPSLYMYLLLTESVLSIGKMRQCRRKSRLITARKNDLYQLVDAINSQQIMLQCHYCDENDDHNPKIWYKQVRPFQKNPEELKINSTLDPSLLRIIINPEHTLIIKNYSANFDEGIYYCHGINGEEAEFKYNYLVDTVVSTNETEFGDAAGWRNYHDKYLEPINKILEEKLKASISLEVMTEWEPWGNCIACGLSEGQRRRRGKCRFHAKKIKPSIIEQVRNIRELLLRRQAEAFQATTLAPTVKIIEEDTNNITEFDDISGERLSIDQLFRVTPIISCRSLQLIKSEEILANVSKTLATVPDFIQIERCYGVCRKKGATLKLKLGDKHESNLGRNSQEEDEMAEKVLREAEREEEEENMQEEEEGPKTVVLEHGERLTLVCPGASASSVVTWKKNGKVIGVGGERGSILVDALGTLHVEAVGSKDAGSYACAVDGIDSSVVGVDVELPPFLKTAEFLRHNTYLGVVMALCLFVYCSGLVVAYTQRHRFHPPGYSKVDTVEEASPETEL